MPKSDSKDSFTRGFTFTAGAAAFTVLAFWLLDWAEAAAEDDDTVLTAAALMDEGGAGGCGCGCG